MEKARSSKTLRRSSPTRSLKMRVTPQMTTRPRLMYRWNQPRVSKRTHRNIWETILVESAISASDRLGDWSKMFNIRRGVREPELEVGAVRLRRFEIKTASIQDVVRPLRLFQVAFQCLLVPTLHELAVLVPETNRVLDVEGQKAFENAPLCLFDDGHQIFVTHTKRLLVVDIGRVEDLFKCADSCHLSRSERVHSKFHFPLFDLDSVIIDLVQTKYSFVFRLIDQGKGVPDEIVVPGKNVGYRIGIFLERDVFASVSLHRNAKDDWR